MRDMAWTIARLDPSWRPWSVPRVTQRAAKLPAAARSGVLAKWLARSEPTPFQRCLAIHIVNATFPEAPTTDEAA